MGAVLDLGVFTDQEGRVDGSTVGGSSDTACSPLTPGLLLRPRRDRQLQGSQACGRKGSSPGLRKDAQTWRRRRGEHVLDIGVGADDVLDLVRIGVLEREAARADQHPLPVLGAEPVHD